MFQGIVQFHESVDTCHVQGSPTSPAIPRAALSHSIRTEQWQLCHYMPYSFKMMRHSLVFNIRFPSPWPPMREYVVQGHFKAPDPKELLVVANNAALLEYFCERLVQGKAEWASVAEEKLHLASGFKEETKTVRLQQGVLLEESKLESTQDGRCKNYLALQLQHTTPSATQVIVHANDTDVIVLCTLCSNAALRTAGAVDED